MLTSTSSSIGLKQQRQVVSSMGTLSRKAFRDCSRKLCKGDFTRNSSKTSMWHEPEEKTCWSHSSEFTGWSNTTIGSYHRDVVLLCLVKSDLHKFSLRFKRKMFTHFEHLLLSHLNEEKESNGGRETGREGAPIANTKQWHKNTGSNFLIVSQRFCIQC